MDRGEGEGNPRLGGEDVGQVDQREDETAPLEDQAAEECRPSGQSDLPHQKVERQAGQNDVERRKELVGQAKGQEAEEEQDRWIEEAGLWIRQKWATQGIEA